MKYKGSNRIRDYKLFDINIDFPRNRTSINNLQFTLGGWVEADLDEIKNNLRRFNHNLKQIIYKKSKDGYYKPNYCFVMRNGDRLSEKGKGLLYFDIFLHLEEEYERKFIMEHLRTIFAEIDILYSKENFFTFSKYNPYRKTLA